MGIRRSNILDRLLWDSDSDFSTALLCQVCAEMTGMTGAGIMTLGDHSQFSACASDDVSARIEELQLRLGEGPALDAFYGNRPVLEPDLAEPKTVRWFHFRGPAVRAGVRAVFGFPLQEGTVRLGALSLYRDRRGALDPQQHADVLAMADVAAEAMALKLANASPKALAAELVSGAHHRSVLHLAVGMISAQLEVSVDQALIRVRAYAFENGRELLEVAAQVVARQLRFDDQGGVISTPP